MSQKIEDYALIGNTRTAALVGRNGSIDWLCLPAFDAPACLAALVGEPDNGHWLIRPADTSCSISRHYLDDTLILETRFESSDAAITLVDFMPLPRDDGVLELVRIVRGERGSMPMHLSLALRFDYGRIVPWVTRSEDGIHAVAGPDAIRLSTPVSLQGQDMTTVADFTVSRGDEIPFILSWYPSHQPVPGRRDPGRMFEHTEAWWKEWSSRCELEGRWRGPVVRSLITLKALTYSRTGGIVAAPTTSLPESIGGERNWDYRYCWLRDATFTLYALLISGYTEEAVAWREWLVRTAAGEPSKLQIMYGVAGDRRLDERTLPWLNGYEGSTPVRIGNGAYEQKQMDIYGEVMDAFYTARRHHCAPNDNAWRVQKVLLDFLEGHWEDPGSGIWEMRGPPRSFTHAKIMAWVALDRSIKAVERFQLDGPVERWRKLRKHIHETTCEQCFRPDRNSFVQHPDTDALDASELLIPLVGFLPATDPRVIGTIEQIQKELVSDGFVMRYQTEGAEDGFAPGEGAFLLCSFWLADCLALMGRNTEAKPLFERLLAIRNDVGLLSEEYDPQHKRMLGNFPQAFSHVGLINTAHNLAAGQGPAQHRANHASPAPPADLSENHRSGLR